MHKAQRLINHVALVLDGSSSMSSHRSSLVKVADEQIKHLALKSEELSQETRVSVYLFADKVECLIFDMDVMRLPSIKDLYRADGMTALVDSVVKSQDDLSTTSQLYGDHAFLTFVLTDGMENRSTNTWRVLPKYVSGAAENWTVGFLVPDNQGVAYMERIGVKSDNVATWDTTSAAGIQDSFQTIRSATDSFMTGRATGVRGTRSVFSTGAEAVNRTTVRSVLKPLASTKYRTGLVNNKIRIDDYCKSMWNDYSVGSGYYQLSKTEDIQQQKKILVLEKATGKVYAGDDGRALLGLPRTGTVRVRPNHNPDYTVFVQSTSLNRNLMPGTQFLYMK